MAISVGISLFIIIFTTIIFPQNNLRGGSPDKFLISSTLTQKVFIKCFDFFLIFSIIFKVITKAAEYSAIKAKKHCRDTKALNRIHVLLFIDEMAMIFFISILYINFDNEARMVPLITINTVVVKV